MIQPLHLRYDAEADVAPAAWFLPGDSAARWLEELTRCGLASIETRLFLVPRSSKDLSPAGLLIVPRHVDSLPHQPAGIGCRLVAGRLFIPLDAVLHPPITDAEVRHLCPLAVSFFHPAHGLSAFEDHAALRPGDLIERPPESASNWNFARPGAAPLPELSAVVVLQPPSIQDAFGGAQDEIGAESPLDLPPAPDEPKDNPLAETQRFLGRAFAKGLSGFIRHIPHVGPRRTWLNGLEDWANRKLQGVSEQLQRLRNKEIHRLLHLLETDPEKGLRHAIPMNSFAHRGAGPPGAHLLPHSLNFDPTRMGGQQADFWHMPLNLQEVLRRRYREMADREMQLGRHRRAAYIYAELLGDLVSAAHAFKQGKLYREAALLYEEHLNNPLEAARCLAEGGLLAEAIERFEKLGRWLDVADLHGRAGDRAAAEKAIRRVVNERLLQKDILGAARLIEDRLHAPDEALEMLLGAWPSSHQAASCIGAAFRILGQLARHEAAEGQLARFSREPLPASSHQTLISVLVGVAREYPHDRVRHRAADLSRVLVARRLSSERAGSGEVSQLLDQLVRLAPQDRLLARDSNRYLANWRGAELRGVRATPEPAAGSKPELIRRIELPRQIRWLQLRRESHWFFALGITARHLTLVRGAWEGEFQSLSWTSHENLAEEGLVCEPTGEQGSAVALARSDGRKLVHKCFPASDQYFHKQCLAGTPVWLPTQGFPFAIGQDANWTVHFAAERVVLSCYAKRRVGELLQTADITEDLLDDAERIPESRFCLAALPTGAAVALGNRLVLKQAGGEVICVELPSQAVSMIPTIPNTRPGVAVMLRTGAVMYWIGAGSCIELDRDIQSPVGAFIPGSVMVLTSGALGPLILDVDSQGVHSVARMPLPGQRLVGVCAAENPGEFALLGENGELKIYRMPR